MKRLGSLAALLVVCGVAGWTIACAGIDSTETTVSLASESGTATTTLAPTTTTTVVPTKPPRRWAKLGPAGEPTVRWEHAMVYDPITNKVILFGGHGKSGDSLDDLKAYDAVANEWRGLEPVGERPAARGGHALVHDPVSRRVILFGGQTTVSGFNDTWAYDPSANTWTELLPSGEIPSARSEFGMVYDSAAAKMILFGGYGGGDTQLNDTWAYDPATNVWTELAPAAAPSARSRHAMEYDPVVGKVVLFGGLGPGGEVYDDLWVYDSSANTWTEPSVGGHTLYERGGQAMVYHPGSKLILLFGGQNGRLSGTGSAWDYPNSLFGYDASERDWSKLDSLDRTPFGRSGHAMVYDPRSGKIIMFGGRDEEHGYHKGTWTLTP